MEAQRIIYALKCPLTKDIHYIGKSDVGIFRPNQHMTNSHSEKVKEWVEDLRTIGHKPDIEILEYVYPNVNILEREKYFITNALLEGAILLNSNLVNPFILTDKFNEELTELSPESIKEISNFLKQKRKETGLTQEDLAIKSGTSLKVIRKLEQFKTNVNLDGVSNLLRMFGARLTITRNK